MGFERGFDERQWGVLCLNFYFEFVGELWPVQQPEQRQPGLGIAKDVCADIALGQLPVCKVVGVEGREERLAVHVFQG